MYDPGSEEGCIHRIFRVAGSLKCSSKYIGEGKNRLEEGDESKYLNDLILDIDRFCKLCS